MRSQNRLSQVLHLFCIVFIFLLIPNMKGAYSHLIYLMSIDSPKTLFDDWQRLRKIIILRSRLNSLKLIVYTLLIFTKLYCYSNYNPLREMYSPRGYISFNNDRWFFALRYRLSNVSLWWDGKNNLQAVFVYDLYT